MLDVVVVGAHGGAGTSTLAALLPAAWDMDPIKPVPVPGRRSLCANGRPIVLAVRNTAAAAKNATAAIAALRAWDQQVAALAIVSDGGPETRDATARFALLAPRVGGVVRIPYVRALRLVDDPRQVALPGKAQQAVNELRGLLGAPPAGR
ncbi:hypothetical protein ABZ801_24850 [Actinomadura sp. NPDC047616]|uniref:hypothetical protein n=1 Tax=Actinomadura sp. NPDC047616 TaxID=3155914 RepID=UPI0034039E90